MFAYISLSTKRLDRLVAQNSPPDPRGRPVLPPLRGGDALANVAAVAGDSAPWFVAFRSELAQSLRYGEHEMLDHPVAFVCVVSSRDADPLRAFEDLATSPHHLPPMFTKVGAYWV